MLDCIPFRRVAQGRIWRQLIASSYIFRSNRRNEGNDRKHKADIKNVFVIDYNGTDSILVVDNLGYSLGSDANTIDFAGYIDLGYYRIVLSMVSATGFVIHAPMKFLH